MYFSYQKSDPLNNNNKKNPNVLFAEQICHLVTSGGQQKQLQPHLTPQCIQTSSLKHSPALNLKH